jgi:hypothetical protein
MIIEICYKVGSGGAWLDGMPISWRRPGAHLTPQEVNEWINGTGDAIPAKLDHVPKRYRDGCLRFIQKLRRVLSGATDEQLAAERFYGVRFDHVSQDQRMEKIRSIRESLMDSKTRILDVYGLDTNWGAEEKMCHGILIADLDYDEICDMFDARMEWDHSNPMAPRQHVKRGYRLKYRDLLSEESVPLLEARTHYVEIPRETATPYSSKDCLVCEEIPSSELVRAVSKAPARVIEAISASGAKVE